MINLYYSKNLYTYINSKSRYSWLNILTYCFVTLNILKNYTGKGRREVLVSSSFRRRSVKGACDAGKIILQETSDRKRGCGECTRYSAHAFIMHTTDLQRDVLAFYSASCRRRRASVRPNQPATRAALVSSRAVQSCHDITKECVISVLCWGTIAEISPLFFMVSVVSTERDSTRYGTSREHSSDAPLAFCA